MGFRLLVYLGKGSAFLLIFLAFGPSALGAPVHMPRPGLSGFDHACGVAVDSEGNVYVASAGESKIRVFDSGHSELTAIPNVNGPCGLAVDATGRLYVSETGTGEVVRYTPDAYPLSTSPNYGGSVTIDSSGKSQGIAVDPSDGRLYVAKGDRIDTYGANGVLGENEEQALDVRDQGGTFKLVFEGQESEPIPTSANVEDVKEALNAILGEGNFSVKEGPDTFYNEFLITFEGLLGSKDTPGLTANTSEMLGFKEVRIPERVKGFNGHIGEGVLTEATGVAVYTYVSGEVRDRYLFASDSAGADRILVLGGSDFRELRLRRTIEGVDQDEDPGTPDQGFSLDLAGGYLAADQGYCPAEEEDPQPQQACTAGHFFAYDAEHDAVDEFEADGRYLAQISSPDFADGLPTGIAVDRSGGSGDGTIYVTSGAGAGARVLAFGPLAPPSRPERPQLSLKLENARAVAVDSKGNRYVAAGALIHIYGPSGAEIKVGAGEKGIETDGTACGIAVDSAGDVYALLRCGGDVSEEKVVYYKPSSFPPTPGEGYGAPVTIATPASFPSSASLSAVAVNPANDHAFVINQKEIIELDSAKNGSTVLDSDFGPILGGALRLATIAVYGANGNVYVGTGEGKGLILVLNATEVLSRITGAGSPKGPFGASAGAIAVDQSNGHVLAFERDRGVAEEYEPSGAFVTQFGAFTKVFRPEGIAVDNSGGPNDRSVYVAFDDTAPETFDVTAFAALAYGEPPVADTGLASGGGAGNAVLNGMVNPRGLELTECRFEYLSEDKYQTNGSTFAGATSVDCAESISAIGKGTSSVAVHADITGLESGGRYRFRLFAKNEYGEGIGKPGLFGPPLLTATSAQPVSYREATLRATIAPFGLATRYHFEYGVAQYEESTPTEELQADAGSVDVAVPIFDLAEGITYHFRVVVENEVGSVEGPDHVFETLERPESIACLNQEFRTGLSAHLPNCRAYELVTPADTHGSSPFAAGVTDQPQFRFNNWLVPPHGDSDGGQIAFFIAGTLPGFEGTGQLDGYRAQRAPEPHPSSGWQSELFGPTNAQAGGHPPAQQGISSDQLYSFWVIYALEAFEEALPAGRYLRTPAGFEAIGKGALGTDLGAQGYFLTAGGAHVVFGSKEHLEEAAAPKGTEAIYDRSVDGSTHVVSVKVDGSPFGASEDATYVGATEDGASVLFEVGGDLYLRSGDEGTVKVASAPNAFAGIAEDGSRVFFTNATNGASPGDLFVFDVDGETVSKIGEDSIFVNISADGSHVYFTSKKQLDDGGKGVPDADNLYLWDGAEVRFVAGLDAQDLVSFEGLQANLGRWTEAVSHGRALSPSRSNPHGAVLVFQSHAKLTPYDNEGFSEIYRYDAVDDSILCLSCDPGGALPSADAALEFLVGSPLTFTTLIPNVTDDGQAVVFGSADPLVPEDANSVKDVYAWRAQGSGGCHRVAGCLALISSGQGEKSSYLYGMSADGHDIFFTTLEKLVNTDIVGSPSIYDARIEGGIPSPAAQEPCQGDACQGKGSIPLTPRAPTSTVPGDGDLEGGRRRRCPKGKRKVSRKGKIRCVGKAHKKHHRGGHAR